MKNKRNQTALDYMFNPSSIAVIGASRTPPKIGYEILKDIIVSEYIGKVYPINPNADEIMGLKCYPSVKAVHGKVDLAVITVPAQFTPSVVRECAEKKVKGVVIIASGFSEIGEEGKKLELDILDTLKNSDMRLIGPNTLGFKNTANMLDASFVFGMPYKGSIALVSQSGALCVGLIYHANMEKIGLSKVISVGNKIDIDDADLLEYLAKDPNTTVVAMYIESIKDGKKFLKTATGCKKPIVAIKAGASQAGANAASSHTGALAGADRVYNAAFKQAGILRASTTIELFDFARAIANQPVAKGNRIGIISNGGGVGILLADACERSGLEVPKISAKTVEKIQKALPPLVKVGNPVDLVGDATFYRYEVAGMALLEDENIDGIIITCVHADFVRPREYAGAVIDLVQGKKYDKPIIACWIGGREIEDVVTDLKEHKIPVYPSESRAVKAMAALVEMGKIMRWKKSGKN
ncbi:MAG: CoA-binding protein [Thermoplasmata archaeon]